MYIFVFAVLVFYNFCQQSKWDIISRCICIQTYSLSWKKKRHRYANDKVMGCYRDPVFVDSFVRRASSFHQNLKHIVRRMIIWNVFTITEMCMKPLPPVNNSQRHVNSSLQIVNSCLLCIHLSMYSSIIKKKDWVCLRWTVTLVCCDVLHRGHHAEPLGAMCACADCPKLTHQGINICFPLLCFPSYIHTSIFSVSPSIQSWETEVG